MEEIKKKVLLVDDDVDLLYQNSVFLKQNGFDVITAENQQQAESLLKTIRPDIVVTDLMMEQLDAGFTLAHHIKNIYQNIPIIIVTGVAQETGMRFFTGTEEEKSWIKADSVLSKPIRFEQLLQEIKKLLEIG